MQRKAFDMPAKLQMRIGPGVKLSV